MKQNLLAAAICASLFMAGTTGAMAAAAQQTRSPSSQQAASPSSPQTQGQSQQTQGKPSQTQKTPAEQSAQQLQTVVVTGSHIRAAQLSTAEPVISISRQQIVNSGFTQVSEILQNLTVAGAPAITRSQVLLSGEAVGGYYINIHNLGAARTLVLINGQRLGVTNGGLADLQQIPTSAIERIDVLKDGASAIYGSDAIGGVVNIITRNHFTGAEGSVYFGQYDQGDGDHETYTFTMGASSGKGSIMLSAEFSQENPVFARNRWFSKTPKGPYHPLDGWTVVGKQGVFFNYDFYYDNPPGGLCQSIFCTLNPGGNPYDLADWHPTNLTSGSPDTTNTNEKYALTTGLNNKSLFITGTWDFTEHLHFRSTFLYHRRSTRVFNAGYPFQPAFTLPGSSQLIQLSPDSYFNPLGNGPLGNGADPTEGLMFYRRGWEVDRSSRLQLTTYRIGGSLSGDFRVFDHRWDWNVGAFLNKNRLLDTSRGNFSLPATAEALGPSYFNSSTGRVQCGTPANSVPWGSTPGSCIPWNPIIPAGQVAPGSLTGHPELQKFLFPIFNDTGLTKMTDYSASLTGAIVSLPAGPLSVAFGYEYRRQGGDFVPGAFRQAGLSTDLSSGPTSGHYTVNSEYAEVNVPILADVPLVHLLSADMAVRRSQYSSFGKTTNDQFSLTWRPTSDLLVGASLGHGFRAPQIADLFGGLSGTFDTYSDPCDVTQEAGTNPAVATRCANGVGGIQNDVPAGYHQIGQGGQVCASLPCQTGIQFFAGANPNLGPEKSLSRLFHVVYSPSWIPASVGRFDIDADYFDIQVVDPISGDSVQSILNDCYVDDVVSRCSTSLFTRDPTTGVINFAQRGEKNSGWFQNKGYDVSVHYASPTTSFGKFNVALQTTYYTRQQGRADNKPGTVINTSNGWGSNFRYRANLSLDWTFHNLGVTWTTRFYSGMKLTCGYPPPASAPNTPTPECNHPGFVENGVSFDMRSLGGNAFSDVQVRYKLPWKGTIAVGANNVFKHYGPVVYDSSVATIVEPYYGGFPIGRRLYLKYTQKFF